MLNKIFFLVLNCITLFSFANETSLTQKLKQRHEQSQANMPAETSQKLKQALEELRSSGIVQKAIKQGAKIPEFVINGKPISDFYSKHPIVLKFYRGSWCPYCQIELKDYQKYKEKIEEKGYKVIVLTPDNLQQINIFKKRQKVNFEIYQDQNNTIAKKMGIAFQLNKEVSELYQKFGINLEGAHGNSLNELPLPGTYIINKKGEIKFAYINPDYTQRLDPLDLLKML